MAVAAIRKRDSLNLFEDSGIHKANGKYYYTYCTNWQVDEAGTTQYGFHNAEIASMESDSPMGSFTYKETILENPGKYCGLYGNNHHCVFPSMATGISPTIRGLWKKPWPCKAAWNLFRQTRKARHHVVGTWQSAASRRAIWAIADELRGAVDGWDFKNYVLGTMFYRYISENLCSYINSGEAEAGNVDFDYASMPDDEAEEARKNKVFFQKFLRPTAIKSYL